MEPYWGWIIAEICNLINPAVTSIGVNLVPSVEVQMLDSSSWLTMLTLEQLSRSNHRCNSSKRDAARDTCCCIIFTAMLDNDKDVTEAKADKYKEDSSLDLMGMVLTHSPLP